MVRTYSIRTFGCQMNVHDSERAAGVLESVGYRPAPEGEPADLVLLNTCAVRENADNRLYGTLGHLKRDKQEHGTTIVVGGCLAQKDGTTVAEKAPWVDLVYGTHNIADLPDLLARADSESVPVVELVEQLETFPSALPAKREVRHHAWTSISVGCDNQCTFCIVPSLRGPERSRRLGDVVAEVQGLVADGVVEVTLLGQNVNSYGRDLPTKAGARRGPSRFAELLRAVGEVDGIERIRFTSPHPHDFTEDVLETMAEVPTVCQHLHLPLQSGSDRVLRAMRRSYRSRRFLDLVDRTRELMPDAALTTDIIVGFPGETDEDFEQTLEVVAASQFDQAFTFQYSPRPGTPAAEMVDQFVAPDVVAERYQRLEALTREHSRQAHQRLVGRPHELLVESASKTDPTRWSARTEGNHLVHLPAAGDPGEYAPGDLVTAVVTEAAANYAYADRPTSVRHTRAGRETAAAIRAGADLADATRPGGITEPVGLPTVSATRQSLPVVPSP